MRLPIRSCIACRKRENWNDVLRLVEVDGAVYPDPHHNKPGRGAWLHHQCFDVAVNRRSFARAFRTSRELNIAAVENYLKSI